MKRILLLLCCVHIFSVSLAGATLHIRTPMTPPGWALMQRELLKANAAACREFYQKYFNERGFLKCVERWGGDDGPDDAIENCNDWPILHALGADDAVLRMYRHAWEGHLGMDPVKTLQVGSTDGAGFDPKCYFAGAGLLVWQVDHSDLPWFGQHDGLHSVLPL